MKWAYNVKYKIRAAWFLTGILLVILFSNLSERNSFANLDESMSSVVNDRLMPATYLYQISNNLYEKRLLHDAATPPSPAEMQTRVKTYNDNIAALIKSYEKTVLTPEEHEQWVAFKTHLAAYNSVEDKWLKAYSNGGAATPVLHAEIDNQFVLVQQNLNSLSKIQVGEGSNLQKSSHSIVSNTLIISYLEISLLIILGLFTLILLTTTDRAIFKHQQNQSLN